MNRLKGNLYIERNTPERSGSMRGDGTEDVIPGR